MKTIYITILTSFLFLLSCKDSTTKQEVALGKGLASPVYMEKGETTVFLSDYLLNPSEIDSIKKSKYYQFKITKDKQQITISPNKYFKHIQNLKIYSNGKEYDIPLFKNNKKTVILSLPKKPEYQSVAIKGQFTNWQTIPLQDKGSLWEYKADLVPGQHQYLFVINKKEELDPYNSKKISNGMGGFNSLYEIPDKSASTPFLESISTNNNSFTLHSDNAIEKVLVYIGNQLLPEQYVKNTMNDVNIEIPKTYTKKDYLRIYVYNFFGRGNDVLIPINKGKVITDTQELTRTDFHTQIMYFLMVDRFLDGDISNTNPIKSDSILPKVNYKGGDLQGVINKIDDNFFDDLGVNTIWLSPITQNPEKAYGFWPDPVTKFSGYHGYWPVSNTKIDYRFGDEQTFTKLLDEAHKKEYNVLLDYVANHIHEKNPIYKKHPDWATNLYLPDGTKNLEKWDEHRLTTWFDTFLPTLDFSKPEVVEAMTDSAVYWVTKFDLDGFRHDATKHIQQKFWRTLTSKIKNQTQHPIYQIGETYGSPELIRSYVNTGMLDGQFNFNLYDASVAVFAQKEEPIQRLADALTESLKYYGNHHLMGNITGNQDRARFISYASGDVRFDEDAKVAGWTRNITLTDSSAYYKLEMLHAFNLTTPGIPCIYYGDEYGMVGANDPDNRRMMKFDNYTNKEKELRNKVKELIALRKNSMALLYGSTQVKVKDNAMIVNRKYFDDEVTIIFNKSDKTMTYKSVNIEPLSYKIIHN
jgi:glycosidase